jgi:hypothetical protein
MPSMTQEKLYDKWSFVEKDLDQEHWYIKLEGGLYHGVVYKYEAIKLNESTESVDFDYNVEDWVDEDPHGTPKFNKMVGEILKLVLDDAVKAGDYIIGDKSEQRSTDNTG